MLITVDASNRLAERNALCAMFEARKRVFVDLLKWDVPVLAGQFEVDQFDDAHARYLILLDEAGQHLASARLLPTVRPGILTSLYPHLSDEPLPEDPGIFEITRFCLSPEIGARRRRLARNQLVTALAQYALDSGIRAYLGVAEPGWLEQILAFGWCSRALGMVLTCGAHRLGALRIDVTSDILDRLASTGTFAPLEVVEQTARAA